VLNGAAQWIQQVTVGWLVWTLSESALLVGVVSATRALPFLFIGPLAGVAIDRVDRRKMLMSIQALMAASAIAFAVLVMGNWVRVWHAAVYMLVYGSCWAVLGPLRQSLVANTVPKHDLMNAIALQSMAFNFTRTIAPMVGGFLIVLAGMGGNFVIQGALYVVIIVLVMPLKTPYREGSRVPGHHSVGGDLKEGFQYVMKDTVLLALIAMAFVPSFFIMPVIQQLPVVTARVFNAGPQVLGLLSSAFGVGALLGTVVLASMRRTSNKGLLALGMLMASTVVLMLFAQSEWLALSVALLALLGVFEMGFRLMNNTLVQTLIPDYIRGRVSSIYMAEHGLMPAGALMVGALIELTGPRLALSITGGCGLALALLIAARARRLRRV
jgi:MFS family permease